MTTKDHGFWRRYVPIKKVAKEPSPGDIATVQNIPDNAMFLKRDSDDMDWYAYVHPQDQFERDTVKVVVDVKGRDETGDPIVRVAAVEADRLFPQEGQVLELMDVKREQDEAALIEEFANHRIDIKTGKIGTRWKPPRQPVDDRVMGVLEQILARLERLEKS